MNQLVVIVLQIFISMECKIFKIKEMKRGVILIFLSVFSLFVANAQSPWDRIAERPSTLLLDQGESKFTTKSFKISLVNASQTVKHLSPLSDTSFDYTPADRITQRDKDGLYHLGDLNIMLKKEGESDWKRYSTAEERKPIEKLLIKGNILAAADLTGTLPAGVPVTIKRFWETDDGDLVLRFQITNNSTQKIEIGSLGIPLIFNNILEGKSLDEAHHQNVFFDPYIGQDAGYLQVNRLLGNGGSLLVLPHLNAGFEAYNPLNDDPTPKGVVFEGFHEWLIHSKANAEIDWVGVEQWNNPTSTILASGEVKDFSLKFVIAPSIREIENKLIQEQKPVAMSLPGYILPIKEKSNLFIKYPHKVSKITAKARRDEIMQIHQQLVSSFNDSRIGNTEKVIIDKYVPSKKQYLARSNKEAMDDIDGVIYVESNQQLKIGEYYPVRITKNLGYDLLARLE